MIWDAPEEEVLTVDPVAEREQPIVKTCGKRKAYKSLWPD